MAVRPHDRAAARGVIPMAGWAKKHDADMLAARLRGALKGRRGITEKRMFGGVCFMQRGNMLCGTGGPGFMFRVGKDQDRAALARKGASPMQFNGRRFGGFVWVDPAACDRRGLKRWITMAGKYVAALPSKEMVMDASLFPRGVGPSEESG